jgi:hypothetical protein
MIRFTVNLFGPTICAISSSEIWSSRLSEFLLGLSGRVQNQASNSLSRFCCHVLKTGFDIAAPSPAQTLKNLDKRVPLGDPAPAYVPVPMLEPSSFNCRRGVRLSNSSGRQISTPSVCQLFGEGASVTMAGIIL